jgi:hypothetical protein
MIRTSLLSSMLIAVAIALPARAQLAPARAAQKRTPVLIELFTSEGCSSCPAADAALMQLVREQPLEGIELIGLEEHVDYWNNLGWADPFSSPLFTQRQESFTNVGRGGMYTPQAVIDGRSDAVGSNRGEILTAAKQWAAEAHGEIALKIVSHDEKQMELHAEATGVSKEGAELWIALVEDSLTTQVPRGENAGRNLPHAGVVRALVKLNSLSSTVTIPCDAGWHSSKLRPIAFVQDRASRHILAAAAL